MPEHTAIITVLIIDRPLCLDCIGDRAHLWTGDAERYVQAIRKTLDVSVDQDQVPRVRARYGRILAEPPGTRKSLTGDGGCQSVGLLGHRLARRAGVNPCPITAAVKTDDTAGREPHSVFKVGRKNPIVAGVARFYETARHVLDRMRRRR